MYQGFVKYEENRSDQLEISYYAIPGLFNDQNSRKPDKMTFYAY